MDTQPTALRPYGPWSTLGLTTAAMVIGFAIQIAVAVVAMLGFFGMHGHMGWDPTGTQHPWMGWMVIVGVLPAIPATLGFLWLILRVKGLAWREEIAWRGFSLLAGLAGVGVVLGVLVFEIVVNTLLQREDENLIALFDDPWTWPGLAIVMVIGAPLMEEVVFRGFLYRGLAGTRETTGRVWLAIIVGAVFWALCHALQYELLDLALLVGFGVILGVARWRTGSVLLPMLMHAVFNAIAVTVLILLSAGVLEGLEESEPIGPPGLPESIEGPESLEAFGLKQPLPPIPEE